MGSAVSAHRPAAGKWGSPAPQRRADPAQAGRGREPSASPRSQRGRQDKYDDYPRRGLIGRPVGPYRCRAPARGLGALGLGPPRSERAEENEGLPREKHQSRSVRPPTTSAPVSSHGVVVTPDSSRSRLAGVFLVRVALASQRQSAHPAGPREEAREPEAC